MMPVGFWSLAHARIDKDELTASFYQPYRRREIFFLSKTLPEGYVTVVKLNRSSIQNPDS
jgi:hypothetical protein